MDELAFRQVHLDFHTSGDIPDVGADFDPQAFVATLQRARVNSVTCFAKCHHGYSYYPTAVGVPPSRTSRGTCWGSRWRPASGPGFASRPTSRWSGTSRRRRRTRSGCRSTARGARWGGGPSTSPAGAGCASTRPTSDYVAAQTEEVLRRYDVDGIFFDIIMQTAPGCVCDACRDAPRGAGGRPGGRRGPGGAEPGHRPRLHAPHDRPGAPHPPRGQRLLQQPPAAGLRLPAGLPPRAALLHPRGDREPPLRGLGLQPLPALLALLPAPGQGPPGDDRPLPQVLGRLRGPEERGGPAVRVLRHAGQRGQVLRRGPAAPQGTPGGAGLPPDRGRVRGGRGEGALVPGGPVGGRDRGPAGQRAAGGRGAGGGVEPAGRRRAGRSRTKGRCGSCWRAGAPSTSWTPSPS